MSHPGGGGAVVLRNLDITGRVVRELELATGPRDGSRSVAWNATDQEGQPVPNGIYFAKPRGPAFPSSAKFLVNR